MSFKMNEYHWTVLIEFMESHLSFARGQFSGPTGKINQRKLWVELSQRLNSLGYGERTPEKWQKTWADIKYHLKKKASLVKKDMNVTGGGAGFQSKLNAYEERILSILGKSFVEGVGSNECGLDISKLQKAHCETYVPSSEQIPFTSKVVVTDGLPNKASCTVSSAMKIPPTEGFMSPDSPKLVPSATVVHEEFQKVQIPQTTEGFMLPDSPKVVSSATVVHEEAAKGNKQKVLNPDHLYSKQPKRKRTNEEVENELYQETITELQEIKRGVYNIADHMKSISETLKDVRNIMNKNQ